MKVMHKTIGSIIRKLCCSRNLTQEQLAENLNITAQAISNAIDSFNNTLWKHA